MIEFIIRVIISTMISYAILYWLFRKEIRKHSFYIIEVCEENGEKTSFLLRCYPYFSIKDIRKINDRFPNNNGYKVKEYDITEL